MLKKNIFYFAHFKKEAFLKIFFCLSFFLKKKKIYFIKKSLTNFITKKNKIFFIVK